MVRPAQPLRARRVSRHHAGRARRLRRRVRRGQPALRRRGCRRGRGPRGQGAGDAARLPLLPGGRAGTAALPAGAAVALRAHPVAGAGHLANAATDHARPAAAWPARQRRGGVPNAGIRPQLRPLLPGPARPARRPRRADRVRRRPDRAGAALPDFGRPGGPGPDRGRAGHAGVRRGSRGGVSERRPTAHPAGRPHRPEQERRPRLPRLRHPARQPSRVGREGQLPGPIAAQPNRRAGVLRLHRPHRRGRRRGQRPAHQRGPAADRHADGRGLRAGRRGVLGLRRRHGQPGRRRDEPGGQGVPPGQLPRRRAGVVGDRRGV